MNAESARASDHRLPPKPVQPKVTLKSSDPRLQDPRAKVTGHINGQQQLASLHAGKIKSTDADLHRKDPVKSSGPATLPLNEPLPLPTEPHLPNRPFSSSSESLPPPNEPLPPSSQPLPPPSEISLPSEKPPLSPPQDSQNAMEISINPSKVEQVRSADSYGRTQESKRSETLSSDNARRVSSSLVTVAPKKSAENADNALSTGQKRQSFSKSGTSDPTKSSGLLKSTRPSEVKTPVTKIQSSIFNLGRKPPNVSTHKIHGNDKKEKAEIGSNQIQATPDERGPRGDDNHGIQLKRSHEEEPLKSVSSVEHRGDNKSVFHKTKGSFLRTFSRGFKAAVPLRNSLSNVGDKSLVSTSDADRLASAASIFRAAREEEMKKRLRPTLNNDDAIIPIAGSKGRINSKAQSEAVPSFFTFPEKPEPPRRTKDEIAEKDHAKRRKVPNLRSLEYVDKRPREKSSSKRPSRSEKAPHNVIYVSLSDDPEEESNADDSDDNIIELDSWGEEPTFREVLSAGESHSPQSDRISHSPSPIATEVEPEIPHSANSTEKPSLKRRLSNGTEPANRKALKTHNADTSLTLTGEALPRINHIATANNDGRRSESVESVSSTQHELSTQFPFIIEQADNAGMKKIIPGDSSNKKSSSPTPQHLPIAPKSSSSNQKSSSPAPQHLPVAKSSSSNKKSSSPTPQDLPIATKSSSSNKKLSSLTPQHFPTVLKSGIESPFIIEESPDSSRLKSTIKVSTLAQEQHRPHRHVESLLSPQKQKSSSPSAPDHTSNTIQKTSKEFISKIASRDKPTSEPGKDDVVVGTKVSSLKSENPVPQNDSFDTAPISADVASSNSEAKIKTESNAEGPKPQQNQFTPLSRGPIVLAKNPTQEIPPKRQKKTGPIINSPPTASRDLSSAAPQKVTSRAQTDPSAESSKSVPENVSTSATSGDISRKPTERRRSTVGALKPSTNSISMTETDLVLQIEFLVDKFKLPLRDVLVALKSSNLDYKNALMILTQISEGHQPPEDNDIWSVADDEILLYGKPESIPALLKKHDKKACRKRLRFLEELSSNSTPSSSTTNSTSVV